MTKYLLAFLALILPMSAAAQAGPPQNITMSDGTRRGVQPAAIFCSADSGVTWIPCPASGAGGGGTDPRVAQGSTTAGQTGTLTQCAVVSADTTYTAGTTQPCTLTPGGRMRIGLSSAGSIAPGTPPATQVTADLIACRYTAAAVTFADGNTGAITCDPTGAQRTRIISGVDTGGRLLPGQGVITTVRTTLANGIAASVAAAAPTRVGLTVQAEGALTANVYLCTTQTTACNATNYDALIPSGAGAGTTYTFFLAPATSLFAYSTSTPTLVTNSVVGG